MENQIEVTATVFFGLAILHTFLAPTIRKLGPRFHLLGEVELVFGLWAILLIGWMAISVSPSSAATHLHGLHYTEPLFVFVIMAIAATRPIVSFATKLVSGIGRGERALFFVALVFGPLMGSFITEPAAMTVTALILKNRFYDRGVSPRFQYLTLGTLLVNISIGGVLTPYAAPPVLMVAAPWGLTMTQMWNQYGWKAVIAVCLNTALATFILRGELRRLSKSKSAEPKKRLLPFWVVGLHLIFLALTVVYAHDPLVFSAVFLLFLGAVAATKKYQDPLRLKDAALVAAFLGGLVVLGSFQSWWLAPLLAGLSPGALFVGATGLTAITDNAALTYLGAQVPNLSEALRYALLAGAVTGGGLTVIANAPNPAGFAILQSSFGKNGISALRLFGAALVPTLIAAAAFWFLA